MSEIAPTIVEGAPGAISVPGCLDCKIHGGLCPTHKAKILVDKTKCNRCDTAEPGLFCRICSFKKLCLKCWHLAKDTKECEECETEYDSLSLAVSTPDPAPSGPETCSKCGVHGKGPFCFACGAEHAIPYDEKDKEKLAKRKRIVNEILETEKSYVGQLDALDELYIKPLRSDPSIVPLKTSDILFSNITSILDMNKSLCQDLDKRILYDPTQSVGDVFNAWLPYMQIYQDYARFSIKANEILRKEQTSNSKFQKHQRKATSDPKSKGLDLSSLLITPIQRFPRYKLLLTELLKSTPALHPDTESVKKALETIEEATLSINKSVQAPKEGFLIYKQKGWKKKWFELTGGNLLHFPEKGKKEEGTLVIEGSRVVKVSAGMYEEAKGPAFGITEYGEDRKEMHIFVTASESERDEWLKMLKVHGCIDDGTISKQIIAGSIREGFLHMKTDNILRPWKQYYCCLLSNQIQVFKQKPESVNDKAKFSVSVNVHSKIEHSDLEDAPYLYTFEIIAVPGEKPQYFCCPNSEECHEWFKTLSDLIRESKEKQERSSSILQSRNSTQFNMLQKPKDYSGTLERKDALLPSFTKQWVVLSVPTLTFYKAKPNKGDPHTGEFILTNDAFVQVDDEKQVLAVTPSKELDATKVVLRARNNKELAGWVEAFNEAISYLQKRLLVQSSLVRVSGNIRRGRRTMSIRRDSALIRQNSSPTTPRSPTSPIGPGSLKGLTEKHASDDEDDHKEGEGDVPTPDGPSRLGSFDDTPPPKSQESLSPIPASPTPLPTPSSP